MRKLFFLFTFCVGVFSAQAQVNNGLTGVPATGTGPFTSIKLGGTLSAATTIDLATFPLLFKTTAQSSLFNILPSGNIGVGIPTPLSSLHLKAGSATIAPLIFSATVPLAATKLTTPIAGAMEFDGVNLYFTPTTVLGQKIIAFADLSNITGTLSPLRGGTGNTTGTATINANMTGDVTSVGNATTIATGAVINSKMASMAANTIKGAVTAGAPIDLTGTQATAMLNVFTTAAKGLVPAPVTSNTTDFLRRDGTWATLPAAVGGVTANAAITAATFTKITYDSKGLVTGGTTLASADIPNNAANTTGSAGSFTGTLVGEVTGTQGATVVGNAAVIGKVLTGYTSLAGTVAATDNIVQAIGKLNGNDALRIVANTAITGATNTKITYDSKGLVTAGTSLVASDIPNITESQVTNLVTDLAAKQNNISLTTNGTTGVATFAGNTLNIPNYASGVTATAWGLLGNAGTNPYAATNPNYIGTTDDQDIIFKRNGIRSGKISNENTSFGKGALEIMNDADGFHNTAIGINVLAKATESNENTAVGWQSLSNYLIGEYNTAVGSNSLLNFISGDYNTALGRGSLGNLTYGSSNIGIGNAAGSGITTGNFNVIVGNSIGVLPSNLSNNIILADGQGNRRINVNEVGNVGIGTTTPEEKLDVSGSVYANDKIFIGTRGDGTPANPALTPTQLGGNHKLYVNGSAIFTKAVVRLTSTWPDYVFEPTYTLPTLAEVEAYLAKNKHLPDVPSAAEVKEKGIDLGDNQTILLKKVEELTMYMIELNKKVETLAKENEELKKKVNGDK